MSPNSLRPQVVLIGWRPPVQKIPLVKVVRKWASLSLTEATQAVNRCLRGEAVSVAMPSASAAQALVDSISELGIRAEIQRPAPAWQRA